MPRDVAAIWKKQGPAMFPANAAASDAFRAMKNRSEFSGVFKSHSARSLFQIRLYWGLMQILVEHQIFPSVEAASDVMKIASGHCDLRVNPIDGQVFMIPRSIAFDSIDQHEFNLIFEGMVDVIVARYLTGVDREELRTEVFKALDPPNAIGQRVT